MKKIFGSFKSIKLRTMLIVVPLTLAYPIGKALISSENQLMIFSDTLLIISLLLLAFGVLFTFARHGDFDISKYVFRRGTDKDAKPFKEYKKDLEDTRSETFNYPLFFGLIYLAVSLFVGLVLC